MSTTITDPAVISSYNRGPLTTTFTPPSTCLSTMTYFGGSMYFGHAGNLFYDSACYPSSISSSVTGHTNGNWNQYYYSPAECPIGWYHATTFTSYFTNEGPMLFTLGSDTTAVLCCPSGFSYSEFAGHQCATTINAINETLSYIAPYTSDTVLIAGSPSISTITNTPYIFWGDGIPAWWQSSDLAAFAAPPKTTSSSSSNPPSSNTNTGSQPSATSSSTSSPPPSSRGLSKGAKAGIGVGISVFVIALMLGIFFYFRRHGMKKAGESLPVHGEIKPPGELATDGAVSELDNQQPPRQHYELADR